MSLEQAIHDHLSALNLTREERAAAAAAQNKLNQLLRQRFDPQGEVRLGGSFARGTAIHPLKDVDLLLVLSPQKVPALLSQNPGQLMEKLAVELRGLLGGGLRVQNRSFTLIWEGIDFDLVPCAVDGAPDILRLPDLGRSRWLRTSPAQHQALGQAADQRCGQRLLPLVRAVKAWRRHTRSPLRSFHLEAMLWDTMTARPSTGAEGLQLAFSRLAERAKRPLQDPTRLGATVDEGLSDADRQRAVLALQQAAQQALGLGTAADPERAVAQLLGPRR